MAPERSTRTSEGHPQATRTSRVATAHAGGGRVTGSEEGDHEVEVTLPNGRQVELHLGRDLKASPPRPIRTPGAIRLSG